MVGRPSRGQHTPGNPRKPDPHDAHKYTPAVAATHAHMCNQSAACERMQQQQPARKGLAHPATPHPATPHQPIPSQTLAPQAAATARPTHAHHLRMCMVGVLPDSCPVMQRWHATSGHAPRRGALCANKHECTSVTPCAKTRTDTGIPQANQALLEMLQHGQWGSARTHAISTLSPTPAT